MIGWTAAMNSGIVAVAIRKLDLLSQTGDNCEIFLAVKGNGLSTDTEIAIRPNESV